MDRSWNESRIPAGQRERPERIVAAKELVRALAAKRDGDAPSSGLTQQVRADEGAVADWLVETRGDTCQCRPGVIARQCLECVASVEE